MLIRRSTENDLVRIMEIYAIARDFMKAHGNPNQWGPTNWPPQSLIENDIRQGKSYVCTQEDKVIAVFFYDHGENIEPTYLNIEDGAWEEGNTYGVVHRIASDGTVKGAGRFCLTWAIENSGRLRIDTHPDNTVMQSLLLKLGFSRKGIIHVVEDNDPRLAFEIMGEKRG